MAYQKDNIFAEILKGNIPCKKVLETSHTLAFYDIAPRAKIHVVLIPKGPYATATEFYRDGSQEEVMDFCRCMAELPVHLGIVGGLRWVTNEGKDGHQEVPHFHFHLLGGEDVGSPFHQP